MKANLKGRGGIKGLFLLHGEKIAITLVALVALWFVYSSMQLPKLDDNRQADDLQSEITQTTNTIHESRWPEKGAEELAEVREFQPVAKGGAASIDPKLYEVKSPLNATVVAPSVRRADPPILNAVDVYAYGGSGLLAFLDEKVRNARILAERQREQEEAKKRAEEAERQQQDQLEGADGGRRGRGQAEGEFRTVEFDPEHPKRRPVEGQARPTGVPVQGDERIERAYWATVVAKVPIREQMKLYEDAFQNAKGGFDPARDFPRYVGYLVERSEVAQDKPLEWKRVPVFDCQRAALTKKVPIKPYVNDQAIAKLYEIAALQWAGGGQMPDVIDERFYDFVLTMPLPPLVGRDWGNDATHPDIPLAINTPALEEEVEPLVEEKTEEAADGDDSFRSGDPGQGAGMATGPYGQRPGGRSMYSDEGGGRFGGGRGRSPYGGGMEGEGGAFGRGRGGYGGEGARGGGGYVGGRGAGQRTSLPKGVDYWLLRFFDFTVEPGKKYKYRVRLVLADPNFGLPESVLEPAVQDRHRTEWAAAKARGVKERPNFRQVEDWSAPSPTVGIPLEGSVQLAAAKLPAAGKVNDEPAVTLLVQSFSVDDKHNAVQAAKEKEFRRGYVANMAVDTEYVGPDGRWIDTIESFKFYTGITVLDVEGGDVLAKDSTAPARVLLMDPAGELHIRSELDDKPAIDYHKMLFEVDKRRNRNMEGGEGSPYGFEGGGRGRSSRDGS